MAVLPNVSRSAPGNSPDSSRHCCKIVSLTTSRSDGSTSST
jgi:hypothetical protein